MFQEIPAMPNLPDQELEVLKFWKKSKILEQLKKNRRKSKERVYYDGPITANGVPHYGHAITWTLKDVIPRHWSMEGYYVERNMGWDTKGILVEYEVEKELKFTKKEDIKKFGEAKFIQKCREFVGRFVETILQYETRLGRWFDESVIYSTADKTYVESMWWALKELYSKGLLYEGYKVVAYSTRAGTSFSTHEVSEGGYKEIEDPAVTVKFKIKGSSDSFFLAWTTTPWTVPGNLMLAANPNLTYSKVSYDGSTFIVSDKRVKEVFGSRKFKVVKRGIPGSEFNGVEYEPPFDFFESKRREGCFRVTMSSHATDEEGTGIVHLAPYGEEDSEIFMKLGIKLFDYLDETAHFTSLVPNYEGMFYKQANEKIQSDLEASGRLFDSKMILHRMPMCYRTGTPLIYKPVKSWYIAVSRIKNKLIKGNNQINWFPQHLQDGNSGVWIRNARDWALSRSRYWGTPLPVWENDKTGEKLFVGSFKELEKLAGKKVLDPHRPFIDEFTWIDKKSGGVFRRIPDVIDVWFDSAAMPFARHHFPFQGQERFKETFPAQYIAEGPDQVRLWFYVMHVVNMALFNKIPYQNVVTIGVMLDETGKKMSKSKRNYKPMDSVLNEYGADVLRYFILTSPIVSGQDAIFSEEILRNTRRDFFLPLWNSVKFFTTYASLHNFSPGQSKSANLLDKWILLRSAETVRAVVNYMDEYKILEASKLLPLLVNDLSTWYIRRSRDRIKDGDHEALNTLHTVLSDIAYVTAPFTPFFAETLFKILKLDKFTGVSSVHLSLYPQKAKLSAADKKLLTEMEKVRAIAELGNSQRKTVGIMIKQPLRKATVTGKDVSIRSSLVDLIQEELNIKTILFKNSPKEEISVVLDTNIDEDLLREGLARELVRSIQSLRKEKGVKITEIVDVEYAASDNLNAAIKEHETYIKTKASVRKLIPGNSLKLI